MAEAPATRDLLRPAWTFPPEASGRPRWPADLKRRDGRYSPFPGIDADLNDGGCIGSNFRIAR